MSEKCLPEVNSEEQSGFRSALFLNMSDYNCATPKRDVKDTVESCRLSIESLTPMTTPGGTEKCKADSSFKFCLSKDLMQRLEESSPFNVYSERKGINNDICLSDYEEDDLLDKDYQMRLYAEEEEVVKTLNFYNEGNAPGNNFDHLRGLSHLGSFNDGRGIAGNTACNTTNTVNSYNMNAPCYTFATMDAHNPYFNGLLNSNAKSVSYNKFNVNGINVNGINVNGINVNGMSGVPYFNQSHSEGKKSMIEFTRAQNLAAAGHNINMYGKSGWICLYCKNFNYEGMLVIYNMLVRVKCNRCAKSKSDLVGNKSAVVVNHNLTSSSGESDKGSPTSTGPPSVTEQSSSSKKKKPFVERVGDWNCYKCKNLNFSFRVNCNRCQMSKKESEKLSDQNMKSILTNIEETEAKECY